MAAALFEVTATDVALTTDEWYTPRWLFKAAGITFDMDVSAPVEPAYRTCPARQYLTAVDDGLASPWDGLIWCNPPYSRATPWVDRFAVHPSGLALLPALPEVPWRGVLTGSADAIALLAVDFGRPDGSSARLRWPLILAARGPECVSALSRVAQHDRYGCGAYHVRPDA